MAFENLASELKAFFNNKVVAGGLRASLWWLFRGSPLYLRLVTLVLVIVSLSLVNVIWLNVSDTNSILVSALFSPWENAQNAHTGIVSFLFSTLVEDPDIKQVVTYTS